MAIEPGGIGSGEGSGSPKKIGIIRSWKDLTWHSKKNKILDISGIPSGETLGTLFSIQAITRWIYGTIGIASLELFGSCTVRVPPAYYEIPESRIYPWALYCGIPGGIPNYPVSATLGVPGQAPTYAQSVTAAQVDAALNTASGTSTAVYLNPGTYSWGSGRVEIGNKNRCVLRGAGPGQTIIHQTGSWAVSSNNVGFVEANGVAIASGYTKGSFSIVLASSPPAGFVAGSLLAITEDQSRHKFATDIGAYARDGLTAGAPALSGTRVYRFMTRITSVVGTTINFATPIPYDFTASLNPRAYVQTSPPYLVGLESLTFEDCYDPVRYWQSDRCWLKDVESSSYPGADMGTFCFYNSVQLEVRRCYVHDTDGWPTQGEGCAIGIYGGTTNALVIDNITNRTSIPFVEFGNTAGAFLYNYARNSSRSTTPAVMAMFQSHGPLTMMNLYEGNIGPGYTPDGYHGSSAFGTLFRNRIDYSEQNDRPGTYDRRGVSLTRGSYYMNIVGNILGDSTIPTTAYEASGWGFGHTDVFIYALGYPNAGNSEPTPATVWSLHPNVYPDPAVASTLIRHANYDYYNHSIIYKSGESESIADSLFYGTKPAWFGSLNWPTINPYAPLMNESPAKRRWTNYQSSGNLSDLFANAPDV